MSLAANQNPRAFPGGLADLASEKEQVPYNGGMTLRDYFAAAAMRGLLANPEWAKRNEGKIAELAYLQADAMLTERQKDR